MFSAKKEHYHRPHGPLSNSADGSLALEAALALTLFLFACVCLAAPIKLFDQQRKIQGALEQAGEDLSRYAYVKYCLDKGDGEVEWQGRHRLYSDHRLCAAEGNVRGGPADDPAGVPGRIADSRR